ncbi:MAG TPA: efflux RND transporter periplasmic adaptor subunit, partial [Steroidobacteraceae bacterium]|nr:efflux RND transporter periplasmic adaptor subunit [Steroidobacteraceae bacterium]
MKTELRTALTSVVALLICAVARAEAASANKPMEVEVTHPTMGSINRWITLPGDVHALQETTLYAKVAGYLKSIRVDKGDTVKTGDTLAEIEAPELIADLARYRAETEVAKAEYERTQQAVQHAPDLVVPVELDRAKGKYEVAKANLTRIETLLAFAKITAPFPGVITKRFVDLGAFIPAATSGSTAQTAAIVTLMNFNSVRVQVAVPEAEASRVAKGQPVRIAVEAMPGRTFDGAITRYAYALEENSKTMLAEIELPNPKHELRPGMYASVRIGIERHDTVLLIPVAAVLTEKTNAFVFVAQDNVAKKRPIKIGFNDGT